MGSYSYCLGVASGLFLAFLLDSLSQETSCEQQFYTIPNQTNISHQNISHQITKKTDNSSELPQ